MVDQHRGYTAESTQRSGFAAAPTDDVSAALQVSRASKALAYGGLTDFVWGHVSVRDPQGRGFWMKASGLGFDEIEPDQVHLVGWNGDVIAGTGPRHIEWFIHAGVYEARLDVGSVAHAHSDNVNAWCATGEPMRALSHAGIEFTRQQLPRFTETASLIRNRALGQQLAATLGDSIGVLIPQHGFVMTGDDVAASVMRSVLLERATCVLLQALTAGGIESAMSDDDLAVQGWPQSQIHAGFDYLVRQSSL
ncbi:MAG: class II aldolase/adducin family protein [Microbacterium sp.]|nr:class II aldolase/adducin family protein [Microbacterium sp.]MCX6503423.1 class II aldolase/adducin family protein [Microbacterium sp.]